MWVSCPVCIYLWGERPRCLGRALGPSPCPGEPDHRSEAGGRGVREQRRSTRRWTSAESSAAGRPTGGFVTREGALYASLLGSAAGHVISGLHLPPRTSVHSLSADTGSDGRRHHRAPCSNFPRRPPSTSSCFGTHHARSRMSRDRRRFRQDAAVLQPVLPWLAGPGSGAEPGGGLGSREERIRPHGLRVPPEAVL